MCPLISFKKFMCKLFGLIKKRGMMQALQVKKPLSYGDHLSNGSI